MFTADSVEVPPDSVWACTAYWKKIKLLFMEPSNDLRLPGPPRFEDQVRPKAKPTQNHPATDPDLGEPIPYIDYPDNHHATKRVALICYE